VTEQQIQKAVFDHLKSRAVSDAFFWHPFSGGFRRPKEAAIYKGLGAIAGLPDVLILHQGRLYCVELKREGGRVSEAQLACLAAMERAGAFTAIADGLDRALACLEAWGLLRGRAS
jgi:VRR-NUC domain